MGRPLKGPVRIGTSPVWYARLTVKPSDRPRAGCNRLTRSLGTSDYTSAMKVWSEAYRLLEQELAERMCSPVTDHQLIRAKIDSGNYKERITPEGIESITPQDSVELILNSDLDPSDDLHHSVVDALTTGQSLVTWEDLVETHLKVRKRKRGRPLAASTTKRLWASVPIIKEICAYPHQLTRENCLTLIGDMEDEEMEPSSINNRCGMISSILNTSIRKGDLVIINPFNSIDYQGVTSEDRKRKCFTLDQVRTLISNEKYGEVFRLLIGSSLRISELLTRTAQHLDGNMLIVNDIPEINYFVKTRSSVRRIPLDERARDAVLHVIQTDRAYPTWRGYLSPIIREMTPDKRLVIHSCRHTYKTLTRKVGMPIEFSDEISGHAKRNTSSISDGYGTYPDERLQTENQKVWDLLT